MKKILLFLHAVILFGIFVCSCAPMPKPVIKNIQEAPSLETKVYALPDIDWRDHKKITIELQEVGTPDHARNQILEKYLSNQVVDNLNRKGYEIDSATATAKVRIYFSVKEDVVSTGTVLAYGLSSTTFRPNYLTQYSLNSGLWNTASLAVTAWQTFEVQKTRPIYTADMSIEVFTTDGNTQMWRGDVRSPLSNDDIRLASNWMIRELLWEFPALDYPTISVPSISPQEFEDFWGTMIEGREFYSPGQKYPVTFDIVAWVADSTMGADSNAVAYTPEDLKEAVKGFQKTPDYEKLLYMGGKKYKQAFNRYLRDVYGPPRAFTIWLKDHSRISVALADLLHNAPWFYSDGTDSKMKIVTAGRYLIGDDTEPTFIRLEAKPRAVSKLTTIVVDYELSKYCITRIDVISPEDYRTEWKRAADYREMAVGDVDFVPENPS